MSIIYKQLWLYIINIHKQVMLHISFSSVDVSVDNPWRPGHLVDLRFGALNQLFVDGFVSKRQGL